jgi:hypothetical protein
VSVIRVWNKHRRIADKGRSPIFGIGRGEYSLYRKSKVSRMSQWSSYFNRVSASSIHRPLLFIKQCTLRNSLLGQNIFISTFHLNKSALKKGKIQIVLIACIFYL